MLMKTSGSIFQIYSFLGIRLMGTLWCQYGCHGFSVLVSSVGSHTAVCYAGNSAIIVKKWDEIWLSDSSHIIKGIVKTKILLLLFGTVT